MCSGICRYVYIYQGYEGRIQKVFDTGIPVWSPKLDDQKKFNQVNKIKKKTNKTANVVVKFNS